MARKLRIQYPGAIYHVMNRGDRREGVFEDDQDRQRFLQTQAEACEKTGWQVQAYCLMSNHFHLVMETPQANLVSGMKWFLGTYTSGYNRRHKEFGHLFSGRYKSLIVDGSQSGYLKTVCDYVHLNPVRAKLLAPQEPLRGDRLLAEWGIPKDSEAGRRAFQRAMEQRRGEEWEEDFQGVERAWYLGDEEFRQELLRQAPLWRGASHYGEIVQQAAEQLAERMVQAGLKRLKWREQDLPRRRKGDMGKVKLAYQLRAQSTMPLAWIAERLQMGSRGYLTWLLYRHGKNCKDRQLIVS